MIKTTFTSNCSIEYGASGANNLNILAILQATSTRTARSLCLINPGAAN